MRTGGRGQRRLIACCTVVWLLGGMALAHVRARTSDAGFIFLENGTIKFSLNQNYASAPVNALGAAALQELDRARLNWNRISAAQVNFQEFDTTSVASANSRDGVNIITFEDTSENNTSVQNTGSKVSSVLAVTVYSYQLSPTPGKIVGADIVFNPKLQQSATPARFGSDTTDESIRDLQSILVHELGHVLGADHSGILSASMAPVIKKRDFHQRIPSFDDMAFATEAYPNPALASSFATIQGKVTKSGAALPAGHLVAFDPDQNILVGAITDRDGSYKITGLPPGNYRLVVEPFDGPVRGKDLKPTLTSDSPYYTSADLNFPTTFRGGESSPTVHTVSSGSDVKGADIDITGSTADVNADLLARNFPASPDFFTASENAVVASPGETFDLLILGSNISTSNISSVEIPGDGITIGGLSNFTSAGTDPVSGIKTTLTVAPKTSPGPRVIILKGRTAVLPGGLLIAGKNPPVRTVYFPSNLTGSEQFVGIGLTNMGNRPAVLTYTALDNNGKLLQGPGAVNPVQRTLPAGTQLAQLSREIFKVPSSDLYQGWIEVRADESGINGFFLRGDFNLNLLDGADAGPTTATQWILTDVRKSPDTEVVIVNPGTKAASLTLTYVRESGPSVERSETLAPGARFQRNLSQLFGPVLGLARDHGFLKISSDQPIITFSQIQDGSTVFALNGQPASRAATSLVVPHFVEGDAGVVMSSSLVLANPGPGNSTVTIEVFNDSGGKVGGKSLEMPANSQQRVSVGSILTAPTLQGSIVITATAGILGNIVFEAQDNVLAAALPLVGTSDLPKRALFAHLATAFGFFHGVAVINPAASGTLAGSIRVFDENGNSLGEEAFSLGPKQRKIGLIGVNFIKGAADKAAGYIVIEADAIFSAFSLFGRGDLKFMAAVPPNKLN